MFTYKLNVTLRSVMGSKRKSLINKFYNTQLQIYNNY